MIALDGMTEHDWQNVLTVMRRCPLQNMDEAQAVSDLINKLRLHIAALQESDDKEG